MEDGVAYSGTTIIGTTGGVRQGKLGAASTASACCAACRRNPVCRGFSFNKNAKLCYLKTLSDAGGAWQRREDEAFTSGMDPGPADLGVTCARGGCYSYIGCYNGSREQMFRDEISLKGKAVDANGCAAAALDAGYRCVTRG